MLLFFGTRASKIKTKGIEGQTECPYCHNTNTFVAIIFGRYFHLFWIPLLPISKKTILECTHCKKSYTVNELPEIKQALDKSNAVDPPKRPLWHGCGCLILAVVIGGIFLISIASAVFWNDKDVKTEIDDNSKLQLQKNKKTP